ncbi:hypothetical protein QD228_08605 [Cobetia sp. 3AK]|uniref:hypothetical protein n=1 Tax=Cobetia sp. 3AK TaxID=3040020 RepID=UPI00244BA7A3|nr:hypothetical protein [Cobetia sp. 3AK]MDH2373893.1 hypothetical protein [Cobetia sp. 3AK]
MKTPYGQYSFIAFLVTLAFTSATPARANKHSERLIQSCNELVGIYAERDKQNLLAGVTTSVSEALQAGYCMGVLDEYRRHDRCYSHDWFTQAQKIAEMSVGYSERISVNELLEFSCERS